MLCPNARNTEKLIIGVDTPPTFTSDSEAILSIPAEKLNDVFFFQTDSNDLNDNPNEDVRFKCDSNGLQLINFSHALVKRDKLVAPDNYPQADYPNGVEIKRDFMNLILRVAVGKVGLGDIIDNEGDVLQSIEDLDVNLYESMKLFLNLNGGTAESPRLNLPDPGTEGRLNDSVTDESNNYARQIFQSGLNGDSFKFIQRINNLLLSKVNPATGQRDVSEFLPINFVRGDKVTMYCALGSKNDLYTKNNNIETLINTSNAALLALQEFQSLNPLFPNNSRPLGNDDRDADARTDVANVWHVYKLQLMIE